MTDTRILRYPDVARITGLSRKTVERRIAAGEFPTPVRLGQGARAVGFRSDEVQEWIRSRPRATEPASASA